jgi:hypothetical protein
MWDPKGGVLHSVAAVGVDTPLPLPTLLLAPGVRAGLRGRCPAPDLCRMRSACAPATAASAYVRLWASLEREEPPSSEGTSPAAAESPSTSAEPAAGEAGTAASAASTAGAATSSAAAIAGRSASVSASAAGAAASAEGLSSRPLLAKGLALRLPLPVDALPVRPSSLLRPPAEPCPGDEDPLPLRCLCSSASKPRTTLHQQPGTHSRRDNTRVCLALYTHRQSQTRGCAWAASTHRAQAATASLLAVLSFQATNTSAHGTWHLNARSHTDMQVLRQSMSAHVPHLLTGGLASSVLGVRVTTGSRLPVGDTASLLLQLLSWLLRCEPQAPSPTAATEEPVPAAAAARLSLAAAGPAVAEAAVLPSPELLRSPAGVAAAESAGACAAFSPLLPRLNRSLLAARVPAALLLPPALTLYFFEAGRASGPAPRPGSELLAGASPAGPSTKAGSARTTASGSGELAGNMNWLLDTCRTSEAHV